MSDQPKSFHLPTHIHDYVLAHSTRLDDVQQALVSDTQELGGLSLMQISPDQGLLLTLMAQAIGAREAVEVGTFTGFSALCIAKGLRPDGRLVCCDVSEEWTSTARGYWARAGLADRIELRIAPAIETLRELPTDRYLDLAFIDADKRGYVDYYEELVARLKPGGLLFADNVLWFGAVADPSVQDDDTKAIRAFNDRLASDDRVEQLILPVGDGLTLARRRD
ncbi:MAG: class I SAM-dependent methyltransferase [Acidimicrobiia bacterium]|nr:class I SAM-dependent methyltransferase [Acidimicrobiia bacterium]